MTPIPAKIEQLKARIARKKRNHESCAADEVELRALMLKQLRRENRLDRKARRVA
jgi:hypothetical protein